MSESLQHRVHADQPFDSVEFRTKEKRVRDIGSEIIRRHVLNRTWKFFTPLAKDLIAAIATVIGVEGKYRCLFFQAANRQELQSKLAGAIDCSPASLYRTIEQLEEMNAIEIRGNRVELKMPGLPIGESPETDHYSLDENSLASEKRRAQVEKNSLASEFSGGSEPLQNPDLRAQVEKNSLASEKIASAEKRESDSGCENGEARAASENSPDSALKLQEIQSIKALKPPNCRTGDYQHIVHILILAGGFRGKLAGGVAKDKYATLSQVAGAIVSCNAAERNGKLRMVSAGRTLTVQEAREMFITAKVKNNWRVPLEQELLLEGRSEHEAEMDASMIESEAENAPASNSVAAMTVPAKPFVNPRIESLVSELSSTQPNAERDARAAREAAASARAQLLANFRKGLRS